MLLQTPADSMLNDDTADKPKDLFSADERAKYEMLCRRDVILPPRETSKMRCRYVHKNNPYLLLAPLKEEEAFLNPRIVLYRQILYPSEIEIIKRIATPRVSIVMTFIIWALHISVTSFLSI